MTLLYAVILLGVLIFVHELGHFIVAKLLKIKVLKFSLGFGPKVTGATYGETEYLLSAIPLGGYVKMLGQSDTPGEEEEISEADKPRAFNFQPIWKRFAIVFAGPLFNVLFAAMLFYFIFLGGVPYLLPEVGEVTAGTPAQGAGIQKGDRIAVIDGIPIERWDDMTALIHKSPGKPLSIKISRDGTDIPLTIIPERKTVKDIFGQGKEVGLIGITPAGTTKVTREGPVQALGSAVRRTWEISVLTLVSIIKLIQRVIPADTIGGPIMIVQMAGQQASQGAMNFFMFMAIISINLGVLNILPIPILDGGHLLFMGIELVRRKPLSERSMLMAQRVGLALLVTLMVFALYNDIIRLITGKTFP